MTVGGRTRLTVAELVRRFRQDHPGLPADSITPAQVGWFLELMADEAALMEAAVRAKLPWTAPDSAAHRALRDRLVMRIVLDSVLAETRAALPPADSARDAAALGLAARQRVVDQLQPSYDDSLVARLARAWSRLPRPSADSSLEAQLRLLGGLPQVSPNDTNRVVARSRVGEILARDVLGPWSRLSVAYRPRIDTPAQVHDLIDNALFERALRRRAATIGPDHPGVRPVLQAHAERLALVRLLDRDVLSDVRAEPGLIATWFAARESLWALPVRVRGVRLTLSERTAADRMALTLRDPAAADSLVARARRRGLDYRFEITATSDPELFRAGLEAGTGVVTGPWRHEDGWQVARVDEILPARRRGLDEVRDQVEAAWRSDQAEQRTRALAARHRKALRVAVRADVLPEAVQRLRQSREPEAARAGSSD